VRSLVEGFSGHCCDGRLAQTLVASRMAARRKFVLTKFGGGVPSTFEVIQETPQHTYQALTKRAQRLERIASPAATNRVAQPIYNPGVAASITSTSQTTGIRSSAHTVT
jgi:protein gp37